MWHVSLYFSGVFGFLLHNRYGVRNEKYNIEFDRGDAGAL